MKPSNTTPIAINFVWISAPSASHYDDIQFPVSTFVYEEQGRLKAWSGYKISDLDKYVLIKAASLKGKDHSVFRGYIAPLALIYLALYDDDLELKHNSHGTPTVQKISFELAQGAANLQRKAQYYLDHREEIDERNRAARAREEAAEKRSATTQTSGPSEAEVYPNRGGYVGD